MFSNEFLVIIALLIYIFLIILRYWRDALIFSLIALVPLIVLLAIFGIKQYEFSAIIGVLMIVHISDFINTIIN